ncbi:MAG: O-antigen ligase family protein [Pseudomonadota bacterium]
MLLAFGVFLSGVLINPMNPERINKIVAADLFLVTGSLLFFLSSIDKYGIFSLKVHPNTRAIFLVLGAFLLWIFLSGVVATFVYEQPFGVFTQTLANYSYGAVICFVLVAASANPANARLFIIAYALGVVLVASFSAWAMFGEAPGWAYHGGGRIKSTTQSVNQLAAFVAPAIPLLLILSLGRAVSNSTTIFFLFTAGLASLSLFGTGSRTALALFVVSLCIVALAAILFRHSRSGLAFLILGSCVAVTIGLVVLVIAFLEFGASALPSYLPSLARPLDRFLSPDSVEVSLGPRYDQLVAVSSRWVDYPIFGVGPGNFKSFMGSDFEVHNTYLGTLMETGAPSLLLLLFFQMLVCIIALQVTIGHNEIDLRIRAFALASAFLIVSLYGMGSFGLRQRPFWIQAGFAIGVLNHYWLTLGIPQKRAIRCSV